MRRAPTCLGSGPLRLLVLASVLTASTERAAPHALWAAQVAPTAGPTPPAVVAERVDLETVARIREEGLERSQVERLARYLTDVIGPRLTGSSNLRRANEWTAATFREWGLANVRVEPWGEFGRGWENVRYAGRVLEPYVQPLQAYPVAWTGSTRGTVRGPVVIVRADSVADLAAYRGRLRNAFVMTEPPPETSPEFEPAARRRTPDELLAPAAEREGPPADVRQRMREQAQQRRAMRDSVLAFFRREGIAAWLQPSGRPYGILRVGGESAARDPQSAVPPPGLVVTQEQYGRLYRTADAGIPVRLEVLVENRFLDDDLRAYNTFADLPGTDLADELVIIGAHLDSWHSGTGATDNAAGSAVMMEAIRILKALGLRPRRTIRIALWTGEEQGLLGSRAWVENHRELWPKISAYLNVDNGTGRIRGIWTQGNAAAAPVFEQILWPFKDLGVVAVRHGETGGTDHLSFDRVGVPGFNFIQDPIEYSTRTHHTHVDTFERLVLDDLKQAAVVVAYTAYHLATRDDPMPRKPVPPEAASGGE